MQSGALSCQDLLKNFQASIKACSGKKKYACYLILFSEWQQYYAHSMQYKFKASINFNMLCI